MDNSGKEDRPGESTLCNFAEWFHIQADILPNAFDAFEQERGPTAAAMTQLCRDVYADLQAAVAAAQPEDALEVIGHQLAALLAAAPPEYRAKVARFAAAVKVAGQLTNDQLVAIETLRTWFKSECRERPRGGVLCSDLAAGSRFTMRPCALWSMLSSPQVCVGTHPRGDDAMLCPCCLTYSHHLTGTMDCMWHGCMVAARKNVAARQQLFDGLASPTDKPLAGMSANELEKLARADLGCALAQKLHSVGKEAGELGGGVWTELKACSIDCRAS